MAAELLRLEALSKFYTGGQSVVVGLDKISLSFARGEFVAVTGESGSGKSTLSHVIGGMLGYESGELYFGGNPTSHYDSVDWERHRRDRISFISQSYGILPGASVLTNVVSALRITGVEKRQARLAAREILEQVELWEFRNRRAAKLSSGQKQRLSIARALAKPAPILIADEPTGNLDPENSAKVMELLAKAAKERLVILVTHEFQEAEPYATRHVVLQDGRVIMDAQLKPAQTPESMPKRPDRSPKALGIYTAALQQRSRPVWSALMVLFFAITAFGVFAFMGTYIVNIDDSNTRIYDSSAFLNGAKERIVVASLDGSPMTEEDYQKLANLPYVIYLERNGYVSDVQYAYREGKDYQLTYKNLETDMLGNPIGSGHDQDVDGDGKLQLITIGANAPYLKTVPVLPEGEVFLTAGREPENIYEVVAKTDASQIGRYATVHISDPKNWGQGQPITLVVEIVGVTNRGTGLYFHQDIGRLCQQGTRFNIRENSFIFLPNENLDNDTFLANPTMLNHYWVTGLYQETEYDPISVGFRNLNVPEDSEDAYINLRLPFYPEMPESQEKALQACQQQCTYVMEVSPENFDLLTWNKASEQVSLTLADYAYTDQVVRAVQKLGYAATSVYRLGATKQVQEKADERAQTLKICAMALAAILLLQIILLRAMFANQIPDYKLLSNLGLTCRKAKNSIWWQLLWLALIGQGLAALAIWLCAVYRVDRIVQVLIYLPLYNIALLLGIHVAVSMAGTAWALISLKKQVYPLAGRESDLEMDREEADGA